MSQQKLLISVVEALDDLRIPYMLTGSYASSIHGQPRATHDIDLVVAMSSEEAARELVARFPEPEYYVSEEAAIHATRSVGMFNLIDTQSGDKVDFWVLSNSSCDRARLARRVSMQLLGRMVWVLSPEDVIIQKLDWARQSGGSAKQMEDARQVLAMQRESLDMNYIEEWVYLLDLASYWNELRSLEGR